MSYLNPPQLTMLVVIENVKLVRFSFTARTKIYRFKTSIWVYTVGMTQPKYNLAEGFKKGSLSRALSAPWCLNIVYASFTYISPLLSIQMPCILMQPKLSSNECWHNVHWSLKWMSKCLKGKDKWKEKEN